MVRFPTDSEIHLDWNGSIFTIEFQGQTPLLGRRIIWMAIYVGHRAKSGFTLTNNNLPTTAPIKLILDGNVSIR